MADEDGQEIAAIASPPPPSSSLTSTSDNMGRKISTTIDMKDSSTTEPIVNMNHVLEGKDTPSPLPSIESSTSQPVSSLTSSPTSISLPPSTTSPSPVTSGPVPIVTTVTSSTTPAIVASSTPKRVILTPLSSAPCVQSNSLPPSSPSPLPSNSVLSSSNSVLSSSNSVLSSSNSVLSSSNSVLSSSNSVLSSSSSVLSSPSSVLSSNSVQLITKTSSPTPSGHPVTLVPTSCPTISLNNHTSTVPSTGSPSVSLLTRAVPASGYINQVVASSPLTSTVLSSPLTSTVLSPPNTGPSPDPSKSVTGVIMSGDTVQTLKQQLPNGTLSPSSSSSSTVVITSSPPSTCSSSSQPPRTPSTISVPVATRGNIVTATSSAIGPSGCIPSLSQPSLSLSQPSLSLSQPSLSLSQPSLSGTSKSTNGKTSQPLNASPLKTGLNAATVSSNPPMSKPQTVFLTAKDGSAMVLQPSTTGGPPTLVPISSTQNTQAISSSCGGTVVGLNHQPVTSMTPRQVLVTNPNHPPIPMQQMIITRPGIQPQLLSPAQLRSSPLHPQPRFLLQQNPLRLPPQGNIRPGAPATPLMPQRMSGFPNTLSGTFLVKTETGFQLVNVGGPGSGGPGQGGLPPNLRFSLSGPHPSQPQTQSGPNQPRPQSHQQQPSQQVMVTIPTSQMSVIRPGTVPINQPLSVQTPPSNSSVSATTPSQMSPNTAKKKCKNFLSTLIRLASDQPEQVATNVRNLIQGLIDGQIPPEEFTNQLQRELNSSPQPCLIPFLKKSLPYLRHSLMVREMSIEGVRAPPAGSVTLPQQQQAIPQIQLTPGSIRTPMTPYNFVRMNTTIPYPGTLMNQGPRSQIPLGIPAVSGPLISLPPPPAPPSVSAPPPPGPPSSLSTPSLPSSKTPKKSKAKTPKEPKTEKAEKAPKAPSNSFSKIDDDDINDVAAMGGVNLQEEHLRMAASANEVGTQIRSCKDENFLFTSNLSNRINEISRRFSIPDDASPDVVSIVSHAAQEYLKTLAEKLGVIAEHRLETFKVNPKYEPTQDVRAQVKFLEELDRMEKKRHEEQEREMLLRAAKSRSKLEDPEQVKLKQKAKEMQRAELEEARQREANETALQAIGFRKKPRLDLNASTSSSSSFNTSTTYPFASPFSFSSNKTPIRRMKRVCMRDVLFLMEQERLTSKSPFLYKAYTK